MLLRHLPLLRVQRDLLDIPRGLERFRTYVETMVGGSDDITLPLPGFNPMSKDHVRVLLDDLLALDAEAACAAAVADCATRLPDCGGELAVGLVVADDKMGGWTDRYSVDFNVRFVREAELSRGFCTVTLWSSEPASQDVVRCETRLSIFRAQWMRAHGKARTLRQMLAQEAHAAAFVGLGAKSGLDDDDVAYTRAVIAPLLDADVTTSYPAIFAALYGDEAAKSLGYAPLGVSAYAGYAVATADGLTALREQ